MKIKWIFIIVDVRGILATDCPSGSGLAEWLRIGSGLDERLN